MTSSCLRVGYFYPIFKSHFSVLQSSKDRFHPRRQASEQASQRTPINLICQSCCFSYLELALSLSIAGKHVFFVFVFEVGGKYGIEERGGGGGGVAFQTEVAYICDHGPMFFSVCCESLTHTAFCSGLRALGQKAERIRTSIDTNDIGRPVFPVKRNASQTRRPPRKLQEKRGIETTNLCENYSHFFLRLPLLSIFNSYLPITIPAQRFAQTFL